MNLKMIPIGIGLIVGFLSIYFGGVTVLGRSVMQMGFAAFLFVFSFYRLFLDRSKTLFWTGGKTGFYFLLFLAATALSMQFSSYFPDSLNFWLSLAVYYFSFLLIINCLPTKEIPLFLNFFLGLTFLLASFGIFLELSNTTEFLFISKQFYHNRITATFVNPNHFASFLGFCVAFD